MAISASLLTSNFNATDTTSYSSASIAPTANRLVLACIWSQAGAGVVTSIDSISGGGMSNWALVGTNPQLEGTIPERLTVYRALSASPGSGALSWDYGTDTQQIVAWSIVQFSGVKTSGTDGADAVVQSKFSQANPNSGGGTVTLDAATTAGNLTFGAIGNSSGTKAITPVDADFSEVSDVTNSTGGAVTLQTQISVVNQNACDWTIASGGDCAIFMAVELAAETGQQIRPDADLDATGWSTSPLFSKINEAAADGTFISATSG